MALRILHTAVAQVPSQWDDTCGVFRTSDTGAVPQVSLPLDDTGFTQDASKNSMLPNVAKMKGGLLAGIHSMSRTGTAKTNGKATLAFDATDVDEAILPVGWIINDAGTYRYSNLPGIASRKVVVLPLAPDTLIETDMMKEGVGTGAVTAVSDGQLTADLPITADKLLKVVLSGGGGSGAVIMAKVETSDKDRVVFTVVNGGVGYTTSPTIDLYDDDTKLAYTNAREPKATGLFPGVSVYLGATGDAGKPTISQLNGGKVGVIGYLVGDDKLWGTIPPGSARIRML